MGLGSHSSKNSQIYGIRAQTSLSGASLPWMRGTHRVPGNLLDYLNWSKYQIKSGGKGGKGSSKGGGETGYKADVLLGLSTGPGQRTIRIWSDKTLLGNVMQSTEIYTIPGGSHQITVSHSGNPFLADLGVTSSASFSVATNDFGNPSGPVSISGTQYIGFTPVGSSPGTGQYIPGANTVGTYTFSAADVGKSIYISYYWTQANDSTMGTPAQDISLVYFGGTVPQSPWAYLASNGHGLGYPGIAYGAVQQLDLGASGNVSNYNFEHAVGNNICLGCFFPPTSPGQMPVASQDYNPRDIVVEFLTDPIEGVPGWNSAWIPSSATQNVADYCYANSIFISALCDSQRTAADWMSDWATIGNYAYVWDDAVLKMVSYGDLTAVGNGHTFIPPTQPIYDLDDDDYLVSDYGQEPIHVDRGDVTDANNSVTVNWANRRNDYNFEPIHEEDDYSVGLNGRRDAAPLQFAHITSQWVAQSVVNVRLKDSVNKRQSPFKFDLPITYSLMSVMDLLTVTDQNIGMVKQPVRILSITKTDIFTLEIEAEEFPWGTAQPTLHPKQTTNGFLPGYFADPGLVNPVIFFEATSEMTQLKNFVLYICLSGSINWGGATVHVSRDGGNTYAVDGVQNGESVMGSLVSALPAGTDPDNTHSLIVDLTESLGQLPSWTLAQANNFQSLVMVDQELIAYETAALTGSNQYTLTYLRRGVYGTAIVPHLAGAPFAAINSSDTYYKFPYQKADIGKTLFFKFTSFNVAGQQEQDIANVTAYSRTLDGGEARGPFPWQPQPYESSRTLGYGDPLIARGTFDVSNVRYLANTDGSATPLITLSGNLPVNTFSTVIKPPVIVSATAVLDVTAAFIGSGQLIFFALSGQDAPAAPYAGNTALSNYVDVTLPNDGQKYRVDLVYTCDAATSQLNPFFGPSQEQFSYSENTSGILPGGGTSGTIAVFGPTVNAFDFFSGPPDAQFDSVQVEPFYELHAGVIGAQVVSVGYVGTDQYVYLNASGFTSNLFSGRYLVLLNRPTGGTGTLQRHEQLITASGGSFVKVPLGIFQPGDIISVRTLATSFSSTTIGDSAFVNAQSPMGLTPSNGDEVGAAIMIIAGTGAFQPWTIVTSYTDHVFSVNPPFEVTPDATSVFIVLDPSGFPVFHTDPLIVKSNYLGGAVMNIPVKLGVPNTPGTWFMRARTRDAFGILADVNFSPWLEMFLPGSPGTNISPTSALIQPSF